MLYFDYTRDPHLDNSAQDLLELMSDFRGYRENCVSLPKAKRTVVSSSRNYAERDSSALFNVNRSVQNQKGVTLTTQRRSTRFIDVFPAIGWYFCVLSGLLQLHKWK